MAGIVESGIKNNEIKPDADPESFSVLFISHKQGSVMLLETMRGRSYIDKAIDHFLSLVEGIRIA